MNISAVIICYNEAANISNCLQSILGVVDEIIVIDSGSSDGTQDKAKDLDAIVYQRAFDDYATQKNWGHDKAKHSWILSLDADESLSPELRTSLMALKKTSPKATAFAMNRKNFLGNQAIHHGSWYPDRKIRLFQKTEANWGYRNPHEVLQLAPGVEIKRLEGDILHKSHKDIQAFRKKNTYYAHLSAQEMWNNGKVMPSGIALAKAIFRFIKEYFLQSGFLDGKAGWQIALANAHYTWLKYYLALEMKKEHVR